MLQLLEVEGLYKAFRNVQAVNNLSFCVHAGEIVGLLGPNGAGKTTTLRCICGILRPDAGRIVIGGYDLATQEQQAKQLVAFIPEVPNPYELLTVREHIQFVAMCYGTMDTFRQRVDELLLRFDLKEKEHELVATLSKGMRQKLAVACAFVHDARVFLCDEPLIGIDPKGQHELKSELQRLRDEGCAILVSTHQLDTAERLCDRVIIMQAGRKLAEGTLAELQAQAQMADSTLEQVFLRLTEEAEDAGAVVSGGTAASQ
ncbi:MAG: ABC transporter ATP-binding protein [Armatimonadota bacterium]|nr:ABC transporter ATP-binding protein [Armatimonadota bacterium]MDW8289558.1 ABC transporter ATP-binding protein [Armatimonadota bacterium]